MRHKIEREAVKARIASGETDVMCLCGVWNESVSIHAARTVVFAEPRQQDPGALRAGKNVDKISSESFSDWHLLASPPSRFAASPNPTLSALVNPVFRNNDDVDEEKTGERAKLLVSDGHSKSDKRIDKIICEG